MIKVSKRLSCAVLMLTLGIFLLSGVTAKDSLSYFMPQLYGWLLICAAALLIVQFFIGRSKNDTSDLLVFDFHNYFKSSSFRIFSYLIAIVIYYALVSVLGFVVTTALFLVFSYWFLGVRKIKVYIVSLIIMGLLYFTFAFPLGVRFPHGFLY